MIVWGDSGRYLRVVRQRYFGGDMSGGDRDRGVRGVRGIWFAHPSGKFAFHKQCVMFIGSVFSL